MKESDYIYEKHLQIDEEEPELKSEEKLITVELTEMELSMLINATNVISIQYRKPDKTEACRRHAKDYTNLCNKLYYRMVQFHKDAE